MHPIRILVADDHALIRHGMRAMLEGNPEFEIVGEASDGRSVLDQISVLRPDVLLMDVAMPNLNGLQTAARLVKEYPLVRIIMLSMHASEEYVCEAIRVGAAGYVLKNAELTELELAIKTVARGESYLTPAVSEYMMASYMQLVDGPKRPTAESLTNRQRFVLRLLGEGKSTEELAAALDVSTKTIKAHQLSLMKRLNVHNVAGLVRYAVQFGLVKPQE